MKWLLIWLVASLVLSPLVGRFVGTRARPRDPRLDI